MADEARGVGEFELLFDVAAMHIDGLGTEVELLRDGAGRLALADELEDFELAIGELLDGRVMRASAGEDVENFGGHPFAHINLAAEDAAVAAVHLHLPVAVMPAYLPPMLLGLT